MEELSIKVSIHPALKDKFELALAKVVKQFVRRLEFSLADEMLSKSRLTDEQISELTDELKQEVAKKHAAL